MFGVVSAFAASETPVAVEPQQAVEVKLGLLTPKSGALGFLGGTFENAFNLAIKDLNAMTDAINFTGVVGDTETDADATKNVMNDFVAQGIVGVVGAAASDNTLAAIPIASENNISMISYASTSPAITTLEDDDYLFRVVPTDALQGEATAALAENEEMTKVAAIALNDAYGQGLLASFKSAFTGDVVVEQSYPSDQDDFTSIVNAVANSDADGVLLISFNTDGVLILDELDAQGINLPIIGTDGLKSAGVFNSSKYVGVRGTAPLVNVDDSFKTAYEAEYPGEDATSIFVPEAYDATMILGKAAIEAGVADGEAIRDELRGIANGYEGVSGTITFDANGDQTASSFEFWQANEEEAFDRIGVYEAGTADFYDGFPRIANESGTPFNGFFVVMALGTIAVAGSILRRKE